MNKNDIREHVTKYGNKRVVITPALINKWWGIFNREVFNGKLPTKPDRLDLKDIHCYTKSRKKNKQKERQTLYGYSLSGKDYTLGINILRVHSRQFFLAVLVHEMVHAYVDMFYPVRLSRCAHGKAFFEFRDIVRDLGLPFEIYYDDEDVWKDMNLKVPTYELLEWL